MLWLTRHRLTTIALICTICTSAIIASSIFRDVPLVDRLWSNEMSFRDALTRKARRMPARSDIVFIGIDEASRKLDQVSEEEIAASPTLTAMSKSAPAAQSRSTNAACTSRDHG